MLIISVLGVRRVHHLRSGENLVVTKDVMSSPGESPLTTT